MALEITDSNYKEILADVDDNSDVAAEYGIRNIPTVLFFKNGEIVDKQVGAVAKPVFVEKVKNLL